MEITYQYLTRDTLGFALKATAVTINGIEKSIFKDPVTDDGVKKSLCGRVAVVSQDDQFKVIDNLTSQDIIHNNLLETICEDGRLINETSFKEIRALVSYEY